MPLHSIRAQLPFTSQTDPNQFPAYEFQEYPKMLLRKATKQDADDWATAHKTVDDRGNVSYPPGKIRTGQIVPVTDDIGQAITVHSREEEDDFKEQNPEVQLFTPLPSGAAYDNSEVARLEKENEELRAKLAATSQDTTIPDKSMGGVAGLVKTAARVDPDLPAPIKHVNKKK